jgi:hypothetical protein
LTSHYYKWMKSLLSLLSERREMRVFSKVSKVWIRIIDYLFWMCFNVTRLLLKQLISSLKFLSNLYFFTVCCLF